MNILFRNERIKDIPKSQPMYFMMKCRKIFDKYMIVWENVSNIIKKINGQLLYNRKYLKTEKKIHKR